MPESYRIYWWRHKLLEGEIPLLSPFFLLLLVSTKLCIIRKILLVFTEVGVVSIVAVDDIEVVEARREGCSLGSIAFGKQVGSPMEKLWLPLSESHVHLELLEREHVLFVRYLFFCGC